jgi:HAD superfamily hydrolase (TIGR01459 family)
MANTKFCQGISDISDSYTGFIIDTWGVLHDGEKVFDSAADCLKELKARNKFVLLMSNTELNAAEAAAGLKKLGLPDGLYNRIITSGELLKHGIENQQTDQVFSGLGKICFVIGGDRIRNFLTNTHVEITDDINKATFMLISGWDALKTDVSTFEDVLRVAVKKRIKVLCVNPDGRTIQEVTYLSGPALIAKRIQELGGVVQMMGKPYKPIYHYAIKVLHENDIYPGQTVMVGDSMGHDIIGGTLVNMDTCLIRNGLHSPIFKAADSPGSVNKILNNLIGQFNSIRPTYLVDRLKWGKALPDRKHRKRV